VIFQEHLLLEEFTALENVAFPAEVFGMPASIANEQARQSLQACGIEELANRFPREMSGGQRQRVAVARGWSGARTLVLADEPTGALDSAHALLVFQTLRALSDEGTSVIVATHDSRCGQFADEIYEMSDGTLTPAADRS
jgi:putative ABC transport system ATP-binding protein